MKFSIKSPSLQAETDPDFHVKVRDLFATEDFGSLFEKFVTKLITKIGVFFENHAAYRAYINQNMKLFDDLNPEGLVKTVKPADLTLAANALEHTNDALEELRVGHTVELSEFCDETMTRAGIEYDRARLSIVKFQSGNWGEGKDKTGLDHPMEYHKTIDEFKWQDCAKHFAERFIKLADTRSVNQLKAASTRHYTDVKKAMARGLSRNQAHFEGQVAIDQINQMNVVRNVLIKFYFKQLCAVMKGAMIQPIGVIPKEEKVPDTYVGK